VLRPVGAAPLRAHPYAAQCIYDSIDKFHDGLLSSAVARAARVNDQTMNSGSCVS
jgi:hypothetical protein